jgi:hypothetical protein
VKEAGAGREGRAGAGSKVSLGSISYQSEKEGLGQGRRGPMGVYLT